MTTYRSAHLQPAPKEMIGSRHAFCARGGSICHQGTLPPKSPTFFEHCAPKSSITSAYLYLLLLITIFTFPVRANTEEVVLKGEVERVLLRGTPLKLRLLQLPMDPDLYSANFDLEERFQPPEAGDPIISELTEAVMVDGNTGLPAGTRFFGEVVRVNPPKHFGLDGSIELSFGSFQTPDGQLLKIEPVDHRRKLAERTKLQNLAYGTARSALYGVGGAATGALAAVYFAGIAGVALAPIYVVSSGAGVGLVVGVISSILKKGKPGRLQPGDEIQVSLAQDLSLPVIKKSDLPSQSPHNSMYTLPGLFVKITKLEVFQDDFGKSVLLVSLAIHNQTQLSLDTNNLSLKAPYGREFVPGGMALDYHSLRLNGPTLLGKIISPGSQISGTIAFDLDFPGLDHALAWKDSRSQRVIYHEEIGKLSRYTIPPSRKSLFKKKFFGEGSDPWE
ncbi:MAG: hypothetical protein SFT81_05545 [Candidatus Caenarcaniphilales bacterium]|nr:hypothetical protein [Candidatus Caenarcaniphilales bacterium]